MSKFTTQHYNAIAKEIHERMLVEVRPDPFVNPNITAMGVEIKARLAAMSALTILTINLAKRFKDDNENFDPHKFLDACSPSTDLYPLSELWED